MIGPTGVGKTEIARRLAALAGAPFVKVEATKYTEVGYVGRDVESMVRDLVEVGDPHGERRAPRRSRRARRASRGRAHHRRAASRDARARTQSAGKSARATLGSIFGTLAGAAAASRNHAAPEPPGDVARVREQARADIERGFYDVRLIEIEVEETPSVPIGMMGVRSRAGGADMGEMLGGLLPKRKNAQKRVTVAEARRIFAQEEASKLIDMDAVKREALRRAGEDGIIFIDEIDKVAGREGVAAAPTFRAKACSATFCRSSKAARSRPSTARSRPITCSSSRPAHST